MSGKLNTGPGDAPDLAKPVAWTQSGPEADTGQRDDDAPGDRQTTERGRASDATQTAVSPHFPTETGAKGEDGDARGSDQPSGQGAHAQTSGEQHTERARASDPAAPDPHGGRRDDAAHAGRGHAPAPEADPGSAASLLASLADSDDKDEISLLEEVSPPTSVDMSMEELHEHTLRRLSNLFTLRARLSGIIALAFSKSPAGKHYSYEECLQWFSTATIDREHMTVVISAWKEHWLTEECRVETIRKAEDKSAQSRNLAREYLRSAFKTHVRCEYGSYNVAKAFLKYPQPNLRRIVTVLADYKQSDGYVHRVTESRPKERERRDADTLAHPDDPVERARCLRNEFMNAHRHANGTWVFCVPTQETMDRYRTGELLREANDATRRSGYGAIRNERACIVEMLRPAAFEDDIADDM